MAEKEITVQVFDDFESIDKILKLNGFDMIENFQMTDWYFSKYNDVSNLSYQELLKHSFLVRKIDDEFKLCYKHKFLDEKNNVVSEEKTTSYLKDLKAIEVFKKVLCLTWCMDL